MAQPRAGVKSRPGNRLQRLGQTGPRGAPVAQKFSIDITVANREVKFHRSRKKVAAAENRTDQVLPNGPQRASRKLAPSSFFATKCLTKVAHSVMVMASAGATCLATTGCLQSGHLQSGRSRVSHLARRGHRTEGRTLMSVSRRDFLAATAATGSCAAITALRGNIRKSEENRINPQG